MRKAAVGNEHYIPAIGIILVSFMCCLRLLNVNCGAKRPSPDPSDPFLISPLCPGSGLSPWLCDRERGKKQAAKSTKNIASLRTARRQTTSNRHLCCLCRDRSMAVVGKGSRLLTHQEETPSETPADSPNVPR